MKSENPLSAMLISNIKNNIFIFIIFIFSIICPDSKAFGGNETATSVIRFDSSHVELRILNTEKLNELVNNKDYIYDRVGPAPVSIWERFKEWFWRKVASVFTSKGGDLSLTIIQYLLITAAAVIIIFLLLKNNARSLFYGKSASVKIDYSEFEEDIHKISFEELITEAITKKDFRKAIRLHFLKLLKELSDRNLIQWKIDKTNGDYSMELKKSSYSSQFQELTRLYEYVWYGDFKFEEKKYSTILEQFKQFKF